MEPVDRQKHIWLIARASPESTTLGDALVSAGVRVTRLSFPTDSSVPLATGISGLAGLAASVGAALKEAVQGVDISALVHQIEAAAQPVDGVVFLEDEVAARLAETLDRVAPGVARVGVEPALDVAEGWSRMGVPRVSGRDSGGVLVGLGDERKSVPEAAAHITVACHDLETSWIDPLLLQLNLASIEDWPLLFLPTGDASKDEHLKSRAAFYGLTGSRPGQTSDLDAWVRGARAVVGQPSPSQLIAAVRAGVPVVLVGPVEPHSGAAWILEEGLASHATLAVQVSVALETACGGTQGVGRDLGDPARAATNALARLASDSSRPTQVTQPGDPDALETIGVGIEPEAPTRAHDELELDDALARLKARMSSEQNEG